MKKPKVKFLKNHRYPKCWVCNGTGKIYDNVSKDVYLSILRDSLATKCKACKGTGRFREDQYYLIHTKKNGQKIAFNVDSLK